MQYGVEVPVGPIAEALRTAGLEARAKRFDSAISWQRRALELCRTQALPASVTVVVELTLGSYLLHVAMDRPEQAPVAERTLEAVIRAARVHGLHRERLHAKTGLATALSLQGRYAEAADVYLRAAAVAKQMGETVSVGEFLRSAGDSLFAAGQRTRAVAVWRTALGYLVDSDESFAALDERSVIERLIEVALRHGASEVAQSYEVVLSELRAQTGAN